MGRKARTGRVQRHFEKTGKCKYGNKCRFEHVRKAGIAPTVNKKPSEKFEGECFHCGKKGHRKEDCHRKQREDLEANGQAIQLQQDSQVFNLSQSKRSRQKKQKAAPSPDSDDANAQIFSISNGGAVVSYRDQLYMLSEVLDDADEVHELKFFRNSHLGSPAG